MSIENRTKLNLLLSKQPLGSVITTAWLAKEGYSLALQQRYKDSQWFESIGSGALIRFNDSVDYLGGVYALQTQLDSSIHPAAKTALSLQGKAHYLELSLNQVQLFGGKRESLPLWFKKHAWGHEVNYKETSFLPPELGLVEFKHNNFTLKISSPARAIMECLYLAPKTQSIVEAYELMEGLNNLRPKLVQSLLEQCSSVKVKRLFLYLAEKANHQWLTFLDLEKINLGEGKRSIVKDGAYVSKYQITVPKELENNYG